MQEQHCHGTSIAGEHRESDNSEHQSGEEHSMCRHPAQDSASHSIKVESAEGAGETGEHDRRGGDCGSIRSIWCMSECAVLSSPL